VKTARTANRMGAPLTRNLDLLETSIDRNRDLQETWGYGLQPLRHGLETRILCRPSCGRDGVLRHFAGVFRD
jgi:hypothetical protein